MSNSSCIICRAIFNSAPGEFRLLCSSCQQHAEWKEAVIKLLDGVGTFVSINFYGAYLVTLTFRAPTTFDTVESKVEHGGQGDTQKDLLDAHLKNLAAALAAKYPAPKRKNLFRPGTPVLRIVDGKAVFGDVVAAPELCFGNAWLVRVREQDGESDLPVDCLFINTPLAVICEAARRAE